MARDRRKHKGRGGHRFVMLRHDIMQCENFVTLSAQALKLLIDLLSQYDGYNNGDLGMAWSVMSKRCWRSRDTLAKARRELIERGWIVVTRHGGRHHCSLYAVTWLPIDERAAKKYDTGIAASVVALNLWRTGVPVPDSAEGRRVTRIQRVAGTTTRSRKQQDEAAWVLSRQVSFDLEMAS